MGRGNIAQVEDAMASMPAMEDLGFAHRFVPARVPGAPTLLLLHGTGGDEDDLLGVGKHIDPDAAILSPRGKVLENGMARFFRRIAEGVFDTADLRFRTGELADFIAAASRAYGLDPAKVIAVGFSNGANIAAGLLLLRPEALSAAILLHAMVPLVPEPLPDLRAKAVFLAAGRQDAMIPPAETEKLARLLEASGAPLTLAWQDGGHRIGPGELDEAREWYRKEYHGT